MAQLKDRRRKPSKGVAIFSVSLILIGTVFFLAMIIAFFQLRLELQLKDDAPFLFSQFPAVSINSTVFWLSTILGFLIMLSWVVSGAGMLFLKNWARQLLLVSMGVYIVNTVVNIFINVFLTYEYASVIPVFWLSLGVILVLAFCIAVIYFFNHPAVISQFKRKSRHI